MREVTMYYAYDDTEFDNREECLDYERHALALIMWLSRCYRMYDNAMNYIMPPKDGEIEDWFDWLYTACETCEYILRLDNLPKEVEDFIHREVGYCILNEDFDYKYGLCMFKWNYDTIEWEAMDASEVDWKKAAAYLI